MTKLPILNDQVPKKYKGMYDRAMTGRSRKAAVRLHCIMCMGWDATEVDKCTATGCPMYPYRAG